MKRKHHGSKARDPRGHRKGKPHGQGHGHGHGRPASGRKARDRRWGAPQSAGQAGQQRGQKTCPMCGAVVSDLGGHIREKHDDTQSHPID